MADFLVPRLNRGKRVYHAPLHPCTRRFQNPFAQPLVKAFSDNLRDAVARGVSTGAFWLTTFADVLSQASAERRASARRTGWS